MIPLVPIAAAAAAAGYFLFKPKAIVASDYQVTTVTSQTGVPIKVATPIPKDVTLSQATTPHGNDTFTDAPLPSGSAFSVVQQADTYAPAGAIVQTSEGSFQPAPIVISPTGASSVAISNVTDIQKALNTLGIKPALKEDGKMGPATAANIKQFQKAHGLPVTGQATAALMTAISGAVTALASGGSGAHAGAAAEGAWASESAGSNTSVAPTALTATLAKAVAPAAVPASSPAVSVADIQRGLNALGFTPKLVVDGILGTSTIHNIRSLQIKNNVLADGKATPEIMSAISAALAALPPPPPPNADVLAVQRALNKLGYTPVLTENGLLDTPTIHNIRSFQIKYNMTPDGKVSPQILSAVSTALAGGVVKPPPPPPPSATAPEGSTDVLTLADVQKGLNRLGVKPTLTVDGKMGPATEANIKQFQASKGLKADGRDYDNSTTRLFISRALKALTSVGFGADAGMSAKDVQYALNRLGTSPPLAIDGKISIRSVAAIKSFQLAHGLVADGVAGVKTKIALQAALAGPQAAAPGTSRVAGVSNFSCGWS